MIRGDHLGVGTPFELLDGFGLELLTNFSWDELPCEELGWDELGWDELGWEELWGGELDVVGVSFVVRNGANPTISWLNISVCPACVKPPMS